MISSFLGNGPDSWRGEIGRKPDRNAEATVSRVSRLSLFGPLGIREYLSAAFPTYSQWKLAEMPVDVFELVPPSRYNSHDSCRPPPPKHIRGVGVLKYLYPDSDGAYTLISDKAHTVRAAPIEHSEPCYGYVVTELERLHINANALLALGVRPGYKYGMLQNGQDITAPDGRLIRREDVMIRGAAQQKIVVLGDNRDASAMIPLAQDADLVVHEATLAPGLEDLARARFHSTAAMAGDFARRCGARRLLLTHFGGALCMSKEEADVDALGKRDLQECISAALADANRGGVDRPGYDKSAFTVPPHEAMHDHYGCILETNRLADPNATTLLDKSTNSNALVLQNYRNWLNLFRSKVRPPYIAATKPSFPICHSSASADSVAVEKAAQQAFGRPHVLLARDHLAVCLPRESGSETRSSFSK